MKRHRSFLSPNKLSLISLFAALNLIVDVIPFTPTLGLPGTYFRLGWVLAPLTGVLLGPIAGGISCTIAGFLASALGLQPWTFGIFTPFRSGVSALQSGLLTRGRWKLALTFLSILIVSWILLPNGREAWTILGFHILGVLLIIVSRSKIQTYIHSPHLNKVTTGVSIAVYCGNVSRHLLGNILLLLLLDLSPIVFISAIPLTLIEQLVFTVTSAILGGAIVKISMRGILNAS